MPGGYFSNVLRKLGQGDLGVGHMMEQSVGSPSLPLSLSVYVSVGGGMGEDAGMGRCVGRERERGGRWVCRCLQMLERGGSIPWSWSYRWRELPNKSRALRTEL